MPVKTGIKDRIAAYVAAHPGCTRADVLAAFHLDLHNAMLSYCRAQGLVYAAGGRSTQRYYPTAEQAQAADAVVRAEVREREKERKRKAWKHDNVRKRALRLAAGSRPKSTRHGAVELAKGTKIAADVRLQFAQPMRDRWWSPYVPSVVDSADARPWAIEASRAIASRSDMPSEPLNRPMAPFFGEVDTYLATRQENGVNARISETGHANG